MKFFLAVVVDYEYMATHRQNIMAHFEKILSDIIRENMKNGGINVRYFTWSSIKIKKGKSESSSNILNHSSLAIQISWLPLRLRIVRTPGIFIKPHRKHRCY